MKVLSISQTKKADLFTIEHEPISSIALMERAANALANWCKTNLSIKKRLSIVCGKGNNGGDGLALARILQAASFEVEVFLVSRKGSVDFEANLQALPKNIPLKLLAEAESKHLIENCEVLIDALFGSGLNRAPEGDFQEWIQWMNASKALKIAIDLPSGLLGDEIDRIASDAVFRADHTLTFQYPKKALLHPFTASLAGEVAVLDIGLSAAFIDKANTNWYWYPAREVEPWFIPRSKHSHKGDYGFAGFFCGSPQTMGAALIASEAALRSGLGLLKVIIPESAFSAFNARLPEAMLAERAPLTETDLKKWDAILIGPGWGIAELEEQIFKQVLKLWKGPLVVDADGINLLSKNPAWFKHLPKGSLITPHPGEFRRMLQVNSLGADQLQLGLELAQRHQINILLKGSISTLICYDGSFHFYDLGGPALAKGGSGDLLAGCITTFLAQGNSVLEAVSKGLYLQGKASKLASLEQGNEAAVISSDILKALGKAFPTS